MHRFLIAVVTAAVTGTSTAVLSAETGRSVAQYSYVVANAPKDVLSSDGRMRVRLMRWSVTRPCGKL